jgi:OPA family glycerol-3-phosphate transporter-like MFS transporter
MTGAMTGRAERFSRAQARMIGALWLAYGAFYFCRSNASIFQVGLAEHEGLSLQQVGLILGALKLTYGLGQLVNGQLAERFSPRYLVAFGAFASAGLNLAFGLGTGLYFWIFVWAANGYVQSLGWSPCMRIAASWFPPGQRGRAIGIIGTGYSFTGGLTFFVAGHAAELLGWRGAVFIPAAMLAAVGVFALVVLRDQPADGRAADADATAPAPSTRAPRDPWTVTLRATLGNRRLWLLALALALIDACRYGFLDWGIRHVMEVQGGGIGKNALKYAILPLGGALGSLAGGWLSDRVFGGRRIPAIVVLAAALAGAALGYDALVAASIELSLVALAFVGFTIAGAQTLLVGSAPIDLARAGKPAAAVGFVNMFGYLGAFSQDQVTPYLVGRSGWQAAVWFWAACAAGAALVLLPLWRARADD